MKHSKLAKNSVTLMNLFVKCLQDTQLEGVIGET